MKDKEIGERLRALRLHQGYTTAQVAEYLNIDQSNYSKIEHGKRKLRKLSMLKKICTLYECTEDHVLRGTPHKHQNIKGTDHSTDLNIIAAINETVACIKMLREIRERQL